MGEPAALSAMRIVLAVAFFSHGAQKIFGWFGGFGQGGTADLMSRFGVAGVIEVVAGTLIMLGLFTCPAAFIASGEMAVAYVWMHWARRGEMWWWANGGELPLIFAFVWLFFAVRGAGPFSLDALWRRRSPSNPPASSSAEAGR